MQRYPDAPRIYDDVMPCPYVMGDFIKQEDGSEEFVPNPDGKFGLLLMEEGGYEND